jgi:hypothetical protein
MELTNHCCALAAPQHGDGHAPDASNRTAWSNPSARAGRALVPGRKIGRGGNEEGVGCYYAGGERGKKASGEKGVRYLFRVALGSARYFAIRIALTALDTHSFEPYGPLRWVA